MTHGTYDVPGGPERFSVAGAALHTWPMGRETEVHDDLQAQVDELTRRVTANRSAIDALETRASSAEARADAADVRVGDMEARAQVDREMIAELQADGILSREHAEQLEQALKSSRTIGAAIGILMASRQVREDEAFTILRKVSQNANRKLRDLAAELVDLGGLGPT